MESHDVRSIPVRTGWSTKLSQAAAAALLFEVVSGLAMTFGSFHPVIEWSLLLHTLVGLVAVTPFALYLIRHWKDYVGQTLSDVLLLGYVAGGALVVCGTTGLLLTVQALFGVRTSPALRYVHLVSTLLVLAAVVPHIFIGWLRRRRTDFASGAPRRLGATVAGTIAGVCLVVACSFVYSGTKYRNEFPAGYNTPFGKNRPFAPSLAHTSTNGAFDPRSLAGSATCGASGCHANHD